MSCSRYLEIFDLDIGNFRFEFFAPRLVGSDCGLGVFHGDLGRMKLVVQGFGLRRKGLGFLLQLLDSEINGLKPDQLLEISIHLGADTSSQSLFNYHSITTD